MRRSNADKRRSVEMMLLQIKASLNHSWSFCRGTPYRFPAAAQPYSSRVNRRPYLTPHYRRRIAKIEDLTPSCAFVETVSRCVPAMPRPGQVQTRHTQKGRSALLPFCVCRF